MLLAWLPKQIGAQLRMLPSRPGSPRPALAAVCWHYFPSMLIVRLDSLSMKASAGITPPICFHWARVPCWATSIPQCLCPHEFPHRKTSLSFIVYRRNLR
eukprot:2368552-Amphidinium_carterae.1